MWPFFGGLAIGAASLLGTHSANKANRDIAHEQTGFQERMSNTSYQRAMEDMRKAGLNPVLAAKLGGASIPSGASSTVQNELGPSVSSAMEARRMVADVRNLEATNDKIKSETILNNALRKVAEANVITSGVNARVNESKLPMQALVNKGVGSVNSALDFVSSHRKQIGNIVGSKLYDFFH